MQDNILERANDGDLRAMNDLICQHQDMIYNTIYYMVGNHVDAEDLTQTVFLKALKNLKSFRHQSQFSTWLYAIALNTVKNYRRSSAKRQHMSIHNSGDCCEENRPVEFESATPQPWESLITFENQSMLKEAISTLKPDHKEIIVLRDIQELSYNHIAEVLDISLGTVKSRLARARKTLKNQLKIKMGVV